MGPGRSSESRPPVSEEDTPAFALCFAHPAVRCLLPWKVIMTVSYFAWHFPVCDVPFTPLYYPLHNCGEAGTAGCILPFIS